MYSTGGRRALLLDIYRKYSLFQFTRLHLFIRFGVKFESTLSSVSNMSASAAEAVGRKLNIRGVIDLDQIATILTNLIDQVDRQNIVIADLKNGLSKCASQSTLEENMLAAYSTIERLGEKVQKVHLAATAEVAKKKLTSGELAVANYHQIQRISKLLAECTTREEVERQYQSLLEIKAVNDRIRIDLDKAFLVTNELSKSQANLNVRVANVEHLISCKLDRSDLHLLESLVAKVELYDDFKNKTIQAIEKLQNYEAQSKSNFGNIDRILRELEAELRQQGSDLSRCATKKETHTLAKELSSHASAIALCATRAQAEELNTQLQQAKSEIVGITDHLTEVDGSISSINEELKLKATIKDMKQRVLRTHYEQAVSVLGREIETKTAISFTNTLQNRIGEMDERIRKESERLSVAMRFVEWFTNRGENYTHNMKIIDNHLKSLMPTEVVPPRLHSSLPYDHMNIANMSMNTSAATTRGAVPAVETFRN